MIAPLADTHAIIWYLYNDARLSSIARQKFADTAVQGDLIAISTITMSEIVYLTEKVRIPPGTLARVLVELHRDNALLIDIPCNRTIAETLATINRTAIPAMPDRNIAATAIQLGIPLISSDLRLQSSGIAYIW